MDTGAAAWLLTSAALVFLMTPGVALFYGGMVRAKAVLNMLMLSAAALAVTMVVWVLWGWSISYAGNDVAGIFGDPVTGFLLRDSMTAQDGVFTAVDTSGAYPGSIDVAFQAAFAMITVALISGALAERIKYGTWMIFVALWITLCYCPLAHMVWNGGLLSPDGAISQAIGASAHEVLLSQEIRAKEEPLNLKMTYDMTSLIGDVVKKTSGAAFLDSHLEEMVQGVIASGIAADTVGEMPDLSTMDHAQLSAMTKGMYGQTLSTLQMFLPGVQDFEWAQLLSQLNEE